MKAKNLIILIVVLVVFVGLAYWSGRPEKSAVAPAMSGQKVLPNLKVNDVAKIAFRGPDSTITMARVNGIWSSIERFNYPVDFVQVRDFLQKLADLKIGQCVTATDAQLPRLQLVQPGKTNVEDKAQAGTAVTLLDAAGAELASILVGKLHKSEASEDYGSTIPRDFGGMADGRYLMVKDNVILVSDTMESLPAEPGSWFDLQLVSAQAGDIVDLAVEGPDRAPIHLARPAGGGDLELEGLDGQKSSKIDIDSLAGSLAYFRFKDVADPALADADTGMDKAVSFRAKTGNGAIYALRIGKAIDETKTRYVKMSVGFETPAAPPANLAETNTAAIAAAAAQVEQRNAVARKEAEALNARLSPWTYLVSEDVVKWCILKTRDTLIAKEEPIVETPQAGAEPSATPPMPPPEPAVPAPAPIPVPAAEQPTAPEAVTPPPPLPPVETNLQAATQSTVEPAKEKKSRRGRRKTAKPTSADATPEADSR